MSRFRTVHRDEWFEPAKHIRVRYHDTGHLLGSSMIEAEVTDGGNPLRIVFSGDVGRYDAPLYHDPQPPPACDYLVCESTYGDRDHPAARTCSNSLPRWCSTPSLAGGVMLMASFAVGRAQQLIYLLQVLMDNGRIPEIPIVLDSPMAAAGMEIYRYYASEHDLSEGLAVRAGLSVQPRSGGDHHQRRRLEGASIKMKGPGVIISSSGMMTGGRILHHLRNAASRSEEYDRARRLHGGRHARTCPARRRSHRSASSAPTCRCERPWSKISQLSGHAGRSELLRWLEPLPAPRQVFLTHGELASATAFAEELRAGARLEHARAEDGASR